MVSERFHASLQELGLVIIGADFEDFQIDFVIWLLALYGDRRLISIRYYMGRGRTSLPRDAVVMGVKCVR